jgi:hypothetical protein
MHRLTCLLLIFSYGFIEGVVVVDFFFFFGLCVLKKKCGLYYLNKED